MNVLIPYDTDTTGTKNPYLFLLMRELAKIKTIDSVTHGYGWLYENIKPDLLHIHWPELLVKSRLADMSRDNLLKKNDFKAVLNAIDAKKRAGCRVIATIHNEVPHNDQSGRYTTFFRNIYDLCDGFIHMGKVSEDIVGKSFEAQISEKKSFIIPHGNYAFFPDETDQKKGRQLLGLPENETIVLSFGAIRSKRELELGITACKASDIEPFTYLIAGRLPDPYKSKPSHFSTRKMLYANMFNKNIRVDESYISPQDVQLYLNSADVLFIPRFNTLNSGNVALGFTFGKVVTGPDYGVIGEVLKETGNPVFNPYDIDSVSKAIALAAELAASGHGEKNRAYAKEHMTWKRVAEQTFEAYKQVQNKQGE